MTDHGQSSKGPKIRSIPSIQWSNLERSCQDSPIGRSAPTRSGSTADSRVVPRGSSEDLGLYLGLYFRVRHCPTLLHRAWQATCVFGDPCLSPAIRWLAVSPTWIPLAARRTTGECGQLPVLSVQR